MSVLAGPSSNWFVSQRLRLHYNDWGNEDKPALILLHGGKDHSRNWDWVAQELRDDWHIIAPDLRGHGDSEWSADGNYRMEFFVYDLAQLIRQLELAPVPIVAHSLGGNIALRYAALFPDNVSKLVNIEGLGPSPKMAKEREALPTVDRLREWMDHKHKAALRHPKRYPTFDEALARMKQANSFLNDEQALHLTRHGLSRNEDGSWSWKFDNHVNIWSALDLTAEQMYSLMGEVKCPTLLCYGKDSWASNPAEDGRIEKFTNNPRVELFENAGHWLHHDQFEKFVALVRDFLKD